MIVSIVMKNENNTLTN